MFGKLVTLVAAALAALCWAGPAGADSYGNRVSTACNVTVTTVANHPISAVIDVKGNATNKVAGTATVRVYQMGPAHAANGTRTLVWSKSMHYSGHRLTMTGPTLATGRYNAVGTFHAGKGVYLDSTCMSNFRSHGVGDTNTGNGNGNGNGSGNGVGNGFGGGGLPNTGGPSEWWLFLGFGLVLVGGSAVYTSRRRQHAAI